jgi:DNA-binding NtrC family response regulator
MTPEKRILVVDDDETVLFVFHDTLKRLGEEYQIVTAASGIEALKAFQERPFDLVITDLSMPDLGGVELTEAVKTLAPDTVVVWITAYGCHNVYSEAVQLGVYLCRDKPLEVDEILRIARDALNANSVAQHLHKFE